MQQNEKPLLRWLLKFSFNEGLWQPLPPNAWELFEFVPQFVDGDNELGFGVVGGEEENDVVFRHSETKKAVSDFNC